MTERETEAALTAFARQLGDRDRTIAALDSMVRMLLAANGAMLAKLRATLRILETEGVGDERRN